MKKLSFLLSIAVGLSLFAGCGNSGNIPEEATKESITNTSTGQSTREIELEPTSLETFNNFDGVTMDIKEGTATSTGLALKYKNNTDHHCIYGESFFLEKRIDRNWYQVPVAIEGDYAFNSIGYELDSNSEREYAVDWEWLYGSLEKGEYRIVKDILDFRGTGDYDKYFLAAEFLVQ